MPAMAEKKRFSRNFAAIALAASAAGILFALLIVPLLATVAQEPQNETRRIVALDSRYDPEARQTITKVSHVRVGDMEPNTAFWFLDPFGKGIEGTSGAKLKPGDTLNEADWDVLKENDPFEFYSIIRLPEWLGGSRNDISAYRAYSAVAISDQCLSKYWGSDGRWRIENPCAGDIYRPWDGVATGGPAAVGITGRGIITGGYFNALASLDLSVDSEGYITAKRPNKDYSANGAVGEGRRFTSDTLQKSNEEMIKAASGYSGYALPLVAAIPPDLYLSELRPINEPGQLQYPDYKIPLLLEAVYYPAPSSGSGHREAVIRSYPLDVFPSLSLDSLDADPSTPDFDGLDRTAINSLINFDWGDGAVKSGTNMAGDFSMFVTPKESGSFGVRALIWGTSTDGRDVLVTITAGPMGMDELVALGKSIPIK